jgi:hypothetical protein
MLKPSPSCPSAAAAPAAVPAATLPAMSRMLPFGPKLVPAAHDVLVASCAEQPLPLEAEVGGVVAADLDDHAFDVDLAPALIELVDHGSHLPVERLGRGDDERVWSPGRPG